MEGLTREQILNVDDLVIREVECPEWGGKVYIRTITATEYYEYSSKNIDDNGNPIPNMLTNFMVRYCTLVICDSEGNQLFTNNDIEALGKKYSGVIERIYNEARKLNGEIIEEEVKNLEQTQSEDSISD